MLRPFGTPLSGPFTWLGPGRGLVVADLRSPSAATVGLASLLDHDHHDNQDDDRDPADPDDDYDDVIIFFFFRWRFSGFG